MITSQKIKLLINDPKFRQLKQWNVNIQEQALNKIYPNQKKIHRSKVVQQCLVKNDQVQNVETKVDFLQSRTQAVQQKIVNDIQKTLYQKQKIEQKYKQLEEIYQKANNKYLNLISNVSPQIEYDKNLQIIEKQINQIKQLCQENLFLKNMNNQIKKRIKEKQERTRISSGSP